MAVSSTISSILLPQLNVTKELHSSIRPINAQTTLGQIVPSSTIKRLYNMNYNATDRYIISQQNNASYINSLPVLQQDHIYLKGHKYTVQSNSGLDSSVPIGAEDMSASTYMVLVCVFYCAAFVALFISLCCRRKKKFPELIQDSQEYYENYMKNKERIRRMSLMQRLKKIRRLWNATDLYKIPVNII